YGDHAFGGWNAHLKDNVLPGKPQKFTGWARLGNSDSWGMSFDFVDANTNKFSISMRSPGDPKTKFSLSQDWQKFEMPFPESVGKDKQPIAYPVKFDGVSQNNWGDRNSPPKTRLFDMYDFRLWTDMAGIAEEERPYSLSVSYPVVGNTFFAGEEKPRLVISAGSWIGRELELVFRAKAVSADGTARDFAVPSMKILDSASAVVALPFDEPGGYKVEISVSGFPKPIVEKSRYVVCLKPRALTAEEKEASPYGINVHGGGYVGYEKFARLGFTWVRDYAYTWGWLLRARGDCKYAGWPWYPKIVKAAEDVGLKTLPCLMGAFAAKADAKEGDPSLVPSTEWRRNMALIVSTFDTLSAFEMDNECDNLMFRHFDAYKRYCSAFGAIMKAARPDARAVSPGLAGIYVEETRKLVESGAFKDIDVVNGHRYCGKDGPEYSKANLNTGMSEAKPAYLRDVWRHWKKAATCDGKFRELWVTEWGWDTLAGQPVSEWEQAAYLQRKWVLAMGNGVEKMFWYWYYDDDTDTPNYFFAGCGIFDRYRNPKPSAASFAALRTFIPGKYEYLGTANLSPNHMVQIVKADGKIVALAYKIKKDGPDLSIADEKAEKVTDMFGRALKPTGSFGKRKLDIAPTWYVGLDAGSDWLKQCPIDLESDFYVRNVGGEAIKLEVAAPDKYEYSVNPPKGWTAEKKPYGFDVTGPAGLKRGNTSFTVTGRNGKVEKTMSVEVDVVPQAYAKSKAAAFDGAFTMDVTNQSAEDQDFKVAAELPEGWAIEPMVAQTGALKPEETKTLEFKLVKSAPVDPAAKGAANPKLSIVNAKGMQVDYAPVIPRTWTMRRGDFAKVKFDGDLSDWDDRYLVNSFMIGPNGDKDPTKVYLAYCDEGLLIALDVDDSRCFTADPGSFWRAADCLEVMITTPDGVKFKADEPWSDFDHQLWFCPMIEHKNMYCGYWCNGKNQKVYKKSGENTRKGAWWIGDASRNTPDDSLSALVKTPRGYRAEMFVPAQQLTGWEKMKPGATVGLSFTLVVQDLKESQHELYWPNPKRDNLMKKPWTWAQVKLAE
ncbi:MAG: hypothetical protein IJ829_04305, partial [Kiritimatiellae bacterium]|nr:hypothetical protein [Kiritimatiellia bacterium]